MLAGKLINSLIGRIGLVLSRRKKLDTSQELVKRLVAEGFRFNVIYDIGAFKGEYTNSLRSVLPKSIYYLFEGNEGHAAELSKLNANYFIEVLSDVEKSQDWWAISGTGDSLFRENQDIYESVSPILRRTRTLDSLINEHKLEPPDLIKLDVQGAELLVLRGGRKAVESASLICLEVPIMEYNKGAPIISEYLEFMNSIGFIPIEILEIHKASGVVIQIDIAFVRKEQWVKQYDTAGRGFLN